MTGRYAVKLADVAYVEETKTVLQSPWYLSGDNFQHHAKGLPFAVYRKLEFVTRPGRWRNRYWLPGALEILLPTKHIMVYGHSSAPLSPIVARWLQSVGNAVVVGTNRELEWKSRPIPLGLPNAYLDSPDHAVFGDINLILRSLDRPKPVGFAGSFYANFDAQTHEGRRELAEVLRIAGITLHRPDRSRGGRQVYLDMCRESNFVLCPRGVGEDTHRLWESIFLGSIPVVLRSPLMEFFAEYFPILQIDSWEQILDVDSMNQAYEKLMLFPWDICNLDVRNWL